MTISIRLDKPIEEALRKKVQSQKTTLSAFVRYARDRDDLSYAQQVFLIWVEQAVIIDQGTVEDWTSIIELLRKYADLPADFADASLIMLCQRLNTFDVARVDRDFTVYRNH